MTDSVAPSRWPTTTQLRVMGSLRSSMGKPCGRRMEKKSLHRKTALIAQPCGVCKRWGRPCLKVKNAAGSTPHLRPFAFTPAGVKGSGYTFSLKVEPEPRRPETQRVYRAGVGPSSRRWRSQIAPSRVYEAISKSWVSSRQSVGQASSHNPQNMQREVS